MIAVFNSQKLEIPHLTILRKGLSKLLSIQTGGCNATAGREVGGGIAPLRPDLGKCLISLAKKATWGKYVYDSI